MKNLQKQKPWWKKKAIISGIIALLAAIAGAFGYAVSPEDQAQIVNLVTAITSGIGGLALIYVRNRADDDDK